MAGNCTVSVLVENNNILLKIEKILKLLKLQLQWGGEETGLKENCTRN